VPRVGGERGADVGVRRRVDGEHDALLVGERATEEVRNELAVLHHRLGFTAVYVTHDQSEALALGDRLAIMRNGRIEQQGTPREVFAAPSSEYVAGFIGMGNRLELHEDPEGWRVGETRLVGAAPVGAATDSVVLRLRSDDLDVRTDRTVGGAEVGFEADVVLVTFGGRHVDVVLAVGEHRLDAQVVSPPIGLAAGDRVLVAFDPRRAAAYDADGALVDTAAALPAAVATSS
jgi:iron(III) transport system ATP-binding protein